MDAEDDLRDEVEPWRRRADRRRQRKPMPLWQELPLLLVVAFCLAVLIRTFLLQAFYIPSGSMEDTLLVGDRVLVNKVVYDMRDPVRGEVVVFRGTAAWAPQLEEEPEGGFFAQLGRTLGDLVGVSRPGEKDFIKRVIGVPGDRVQCCDEQGRLTVNGHPLDESGYVSRNSPLDLPPAANDCGPRRFEEIVVPPGQLFVMGDHRLVSQDARCQGPVPIDNVIGRAFAVVWPYSQWSSLSVPETFETLPQSVALAPEATPSKSDNPGGFAVVVPVVGSFLFAARSRLRPPSRRRRLVP
ncbi:signal peptidase I [Polymorphospora rubra]|uniref:signal peptidase I n=1 Tax=Polymorphospora rubra TaxID=338584 RepID=UPI0033DE7BA7